MDTTSFRYLLTFIVNFFLDIYLLDVITAYLYGTLDTNLYITLPPDYFLAIPPVKPDKYSGLKILKALYGLKEADRMWYHYLRDLLVSKGFTHNIIPPPPHTHIFTLYKPTGFVIGGQRLKPHRDIFCLQTH